MNAKTSVEQTNGKPDASGFVVKVLIRIVIFMLVMAAILFTLAGRLNWVMGWAFFAVYAAVAAVAALTVPLEQKLIEERTRLKEDVKAWDKPITITLSVLTPLGMLVVAGLDERFGWSPPIPLALQIAGLVLVALGSLLGAWAAAANKFFARFVRIQKDRGHTVVSGGPYRFVRHPGYVGTIIFYLATALALSSLWTLIPSGLMSLLLVIRTALEDRTLQEELPGYAEYAQQTRYRLLPGIW